MNLFKIRSAEVVNSTMDYYKNVVVCSRYCCTALSLVILVICRSVTNNDTLMHCRLVFNAAIINRMMTCLDYIICLTGCYCDSLSNVCPLDGWHSPHSSAIFKIQFNCLSPDSSLRCGCVFSSPYLISTTSSPPLPPPILCSFLIMI